MRRAEAYGRSMVRGALPLVGLLILGTGVAVAGERPPTVVELFTSEGCNSCPPADALLGELLKRNDVIALSYHVDYWDYLGWKDTFASKLTTDRQRSYGASLGSNYVYTPQMVIGGTTDAVGSDAQAVSEAIAKREQSPDNVPVMVSEPAAGKILVSVPSAKVKRDAVLWLVRYDSKHTVAIQRGENSGSSITYYNVVRDIEKLGHWDGQATAINVDPASLGAAEHALVLLQTGGTGPIIGSAKLPDHSGS